MGACHCGCQSEEFPLCSKNLLAHPGELETQGFSAVFSPPSFPLPSTAKPDVEHFDVGNGRFIERHGANYLVVQADNRAMADQIVAEFELQRSRHLKSPVRPPAPGEEESLAGKGLSPRQPPKVRQASPKATALPPLELPMEQGKDPAVSSMRPLHTYGSGATYSGEWAGELRHGRGIQTWPNGSRYEGQWVHDRAEGVGRFLRESGDVYEGQFRADRVHGKGVFRPVKGAVYEGQWENDVQHGYGEEVWPDGICFVGQFRSGAKSGRGRFTWPNGSSYEGDFADNLIHGFGYHDWSDGRSYRGQWSKEKMHGAGVFTFPDGRSYEGQYVNDLKHGFGVFRWPDGRQYEGQWREGKQHGFAVYYTASGDSRAGEWEDGKWLRWTSDPADGEGEDKLPSLLERGAAAEAQKPPASTRLPSWTQRRPSASHESASSGRPHSNR